MRLEPIDVIEATGQPLCFFCKCSRHEFPCEFGWQLRPETEEDRQLVMTVLGTTGPIIACSNCAEAYCMPVYGPVHWLEDMVGLREALPEGASFGPVPPAQPPQGFRDPILVAPGANAGEHKA